MFIQHASVYHARKGRSAARGGAVAGLHLKRGLWRTPGPWRCAQGFPRRCGNNTCRPYSHHHFVPSAPTPGTDAHRVVADLAPPTSIGDQLLELSSCHLVNRFPYPRVQTGRIETGPAWRWRFCLFAVGNIPELKRNDIVAMTLWADHARVYLSGDENKTRKVPSVALCSHAFRKCGTGGAPKL